MVARSWYARQQARSSVAEDIVISSNRYTKEDDGKCEEWDGDEHNGAKATDLGNT